LFVPVVHLLPALLPINVFDCPVVHIDPALPPTKVLLFPVVLLLPALLPINIPLYLYVIPIILTAAIIFCCAILFQDKLSFLGLTGTSESLMVHDINIDYDRSSGKIVASYKIVNSSQGFVPVPLIRIRLLDANHRTLKTHIVENAKVDLAPKQYITIRTNFAEAPPNVEYMDITLGSRLDFILR